MVILLPRILVTNGGLDGVGKIIFNMDFEDNDEKERHEFLL
jgi:hypothetical protein